MTSLLRLFELLRIAEQHDALAPPGDGQHVGERHLPRFVHEEDVDGAANSGRAHSQAVPPRTSTSPVRSASAFGLSGSVTGDPSHQSVGLSELHRCPERLRSRGEPPPAGCESPCGCGGDADLLARRGRGRGSSARRRRSCRPRAAPGWRAWCDRDRRRGARRSPRRSRSPPARTHPSGAAGGGGRAGRCRTSPPCQDS